MNTKKALLLVLACAAGSGFSETLIVSDSPTVVRNAEIREALRQDGEWTDENIQANPYLFIQDQIRRCDELKATIDAQTITLNRLRKQAARTAKDSDDLLARTTNFLATAKAAYKSAAASGSWPVKIRDSELSQEVLEDKIAEALERVELLKSDRANAESALKKVERRQATLAAKKRELSSLRLALVQQAEQVKMNSAITEIGELSAVLGTLQDMTLDIDPAASAPSLEDLTQDDPDKARKSAVKAFLDD